MPTIVKKRPAFRRSSGRAVDPTDASCAYLTLSETGWDLDER